MKKKVYWIIAVVFVLIVGLSWFFTLCFPPDPVIETFSAKMNEAFWMDPAHVQETITTTRGSGSPVVYTRETWMSKDHFGRIQTYSDGQKTFETSWDEAEYLTSTVKNGSQNGITTITSIEFSYYRIPYLKNVSYVETDDQFIFTYQNEDIKERSERRKINGSPAPYTDASSVTVFTKDWILQSVTSTERWEEVQKDGAVVPVEQVKHAVYLPCTQESFMEDIRQVAALAQREAELDGFS